MDVDSIANCAIKSEVVLTETFAFSGKYEDCGDSQEPKTDLAVNEELFKCKEEDSVEHIDIHAARMQCINEYNLTIEKDYQIEHMEFIKNVQYSCDKCNFITELESSIKEHLKIHSGVDGQYITEDCNFKMSELKTARFRNEHNLKRHIKIRKGEDVICDKYKCTECDYKTVRKYRLNEHIKIHTGDAYDCKECDYKTVWKYELNAHIKIHTGNEYKCKECDYKTVRKNQLKEHIKIHTGDEYKCKECDYKTVRKNQLKEHIKIHTGDEYKCKECDYKTVWKKQLNAHIKIHAGDEYKCKECDYKTVWKYQLKEHIKIHTGNEYKCKECVYKTAWKNCLTKHVKIHTGDEYKCKECDYKTVWKNELNAHIKIHTGDEYKCKECDYKTVRKNQLKEHIKIHTGDEYKCKECDYKTIWKKQLNAHIKIHADTWDEACRKLKTAEEKSDVIAIELLMSGQKQSKNQKTLFTSVNENNSAMHRTHVDKILTSISDQQNTCNVLNSSSKFIDEKECIGIRKNDLRKDLLHQLLLKNQIYKTRLHTIDELKNAITDAIQNITEAQLINVFENMKRRVDACNANNGGHFEMLL
ncbi:hypothetical protein FQA39_LY06345 [Lamprigera yunnana]|nr:hypothetical protein FQA39_LY06345 [Lamprigera yunnana]